MAAPTFTAQTMNDIVLATQYHLGRLKFQQIAQSLTHYEVWTKWFKKDRVTFDSGQGIQRTLMTKIDSAAAAHVGYLQEDEVNIIDVLSRLQIPWRHATTHWGLVYQTDVLMNSAEALVVNVLKPRRMAALLALVELLENAAWAAPPSSDDETEPFGLPYWVVTNTSTGFNGGAASGHTTVGGVSMTAVPAFKNYTAQYTAVSKADLIKKMRTAHRACRFISPITVDDYRGSAGERYRVYVNEATISDIEDVGEASNDNLGRDIASMDGTMVFRKHPIVHVPKLDENTSNPLYMIDHSTFYPVILKGDYLRESEPQKAPNQHNAYQVFVDLSYNYLCLDRRRNAAFTK